MTVVIGIQESLGDSEMADLSRSLHTEAGVSSVRRTRTNRLLLIEYDGNRARRSDILYHFADRGLHASIAGC